MLHIISSFPDDSAPFDEPVVTGRSELLKCQLGRLLLELALCSWTLERGGSLPRRVGPGLLQAPSSLLPGAQQGPGCELGGPGGLLGVLRAACFRETSPHTFTPTAGAALRVFNVGQWVEAQSGSGGQEEQPEVEGGQPSGKHRALVTAGAAKTHCRA